jgi:hypothetical protein
MSNTKEIVKTAVLRTDEEIPCPFGLLISEGACHLVGPIINKMAPLNIMGDQSSEEEMVEIKKANQYIYKWQCPGTKCPYAGSIFKSDDGKTDEVVQCTWGEEGADGTALVGSPYYWNMFSGIGMTGLYSYPLGYYSEAPITPSYFGDYSLENPHASDNNKDKIKK